MATESRKSKIVMPQMVNPLHGPTDSEQTALRTNNGNITVTQALIRDILKWHSMNATDTSANDIVEVKAATVSSRKNNDDQNCVPPI